VPKKRADETNQGDQEATSEFVAEYELRVKDFRVLYNVDELEVELEVVILLVGKKKGNKLIVEKEDFHGHKGDTP